MAEDRTSNWLNALRPKFASVFRSDKTEKPETPDNLWSKCGNCGQMIFHRDLEAALKVCTSCNHHMRMSAPERLKSVFDDGKWRDVPLPDVPTDPLKFRDQKKYIDRLREARTKNDVNDAVQVGIGPINGLDVTVAVQDFSFMGGSMGMATGEAIIAAARTAVDNKTALVIFSASGGARMQEGILSLMQLPRTTVAVQEVKEAGLPYIVVQTDPTTGGVSASYAMLGDIHISEPNALIGFAGARVIEQTIREKLPPGFQRAEYLLEHGMIDMVVPRSEMKDTLSRVIRILMKRGPAPVTASKGGQGEAAGSGRAAPTRAGDGNTPASDMPPPAHLSTP